MLLDPSTEAFLAGRPGIRARWLIWIEAKNRLTGAEQTQGFWTGDDDATFTIGGQSRDYFGAGGFIALRELTYEAGTNVQMQRLTMGPVTEEVKQALRTYEPRLAPVEVHLALFDTTTNALIGTPRAFTGWIDDAHSASEEVRQRPAGALRRPGPPLRGRRGQHPGLVG